MVTCHVSCTNFTRPQVFDKVSNSPKVVIHRVLQIISNFTTEVTDGAAVFDEMGMRSVV